MEPGWLAGEHEDDVWQAGFLAEDLEDGQLGFLPELAWEDKDNVFCYYDEEGAFQTRRFRRRKLFRRRPRRSRRRSVSKGKGRSGRSGRRNFRGNQEVKRRFYPRSRIPRLLGNKGKGRSDSHRGRSRGRSRTRRFPGPRRRFTKSRRHGGRRSYMAEEEEDDNSLYDSERDFDEEWLLDLDDREEEEY